MEASMSDYSGLEKLTPSIIKYPFKKILKAFINIKLGRRVAYSLFIILAGLLGIAIGYIFPGIGSFIGFILYLFMDSAVNFVILNGINMVISMLLGSSLSIYITTEIFKSYYMNKYGISNPELKLTKTDREFLKLQFAEDDFSNDEIKKKIKGLELRIDFLIDKIRFFKIQNDDDKKRTAKYAIRDLKRGEMSFFLETYEDAFIKRQQRLEKLKIKTIETKTKETTTDDIEIKAASGDNDIGAEQLDEQDYETVSDISTKDIWRYCS
jgi:hypothetical protein